MFDALAAVLDELDCDDEVDRRCDLVVEMSLGCEELWFPNADCIVEHATIDFCSCGEDGASATCGIEDHCIEPRVAWSTCVGEQNPLLGADLVSSTP
jgi:hypothetical protein